VSAENAQVILVVKELGLRSTLAARLALVGASVTTAENYRDCAVRRFDPEGTLLVLDQAAYEAEPDRWIQSLDAENGWRRLLVLIGEADPPAGLDPRIQWARRYQGFDALLALLHE